jgi:hypothetical protein
MSLLKKIKQLTESNCHTDSLLLALKYLNLDKEVYESKRNELDRIGGIHEQVGYLTPELNLRRKEVQNFILAAAKEKLSPEAYEEFHQCL